MKILGEIEENRLSSLGSSDCSVRKSESVGSAW